MNEVPQPLETPDFTDLTKTVAEYMAELAKPPEAWRRLDNYEEYIFEAAVEAMYGKEVWGWINDQDL